VAGTALAAFRRRPAADFSDCLILEIARRSGHVPLGTFDRDLGRIDGVQRLGKL
jgi:predicted nucleic acid-binding protein